MKTIVLLGLLLSGLGISQVAFADEPPEQCNVEYKLKCECSPIGTFEGYQLYVVEKCLDLENWHLLEKRQYELDSCEQARLGHPVCRWLGGVGLNLKPQTR